MNKISVAQLSALLISCDAFALICLTSSLTLTSLLGFTIGTVIQFIIAIPALFCISKGEKITSSVANRWIYLIYSLAWGGLILIRIWHTSEVIYIPLESEFGEKLLITALVCAACLYIASTGLKALARSAVIIGGFGIICLIIIILGALGKADISHIKSGNRSMADEIFTGLTMSGSFGTFILLAENINYKKIKLSALYFLIRAVFVAIVGGISILVAGRIKSQFPIITAVELSQPIKSQRIDAVFILIFVVLAIVSLALQTIVSSQLIQKVFPKFAKFRYTSALILITLMGLSLSNTNLYSSFYAVIFIIAYLVPTLITLTKQKGE